MKYTEDSPYGYWISHDEIIPVVDEESHWDVAFDILKTQTKHVGVYSMMFRLGYVRVINYQYGGYGVQYWKNARLSHLQKDFIKDATHVHESDYMHNEYYGIGRIV